MYFDNFLKALPIIGYSLIGIFGVIGVIIGVVCLLNKFSAWVETRGENQNEN